MQRSARSPCSASPGCRRTITTGCLKAHRTWCAARIPGSARTGPGDRFVGQPYPQPDHAHFAKLDAFLTRFAQATGAPTPARELMYALAGQRDAHAAARRYDAVPDSLRTAHRQWTAHLAAHTDLASALVGFCRDRL